MKRFTIINALIWAILILVISYFAKDLPNYKYVYGMLVFASGLQISLLNGLAEKDKKKIC